MKVNNKFSFDIQKVVNLSAGDAPWYSPIDSSMTPQLSKGDNFGWH